MDKNTVIAIILSAIVLVGSMFLRNKFFPQQQPQPVQTAPAAEQAAPKSEPALPEPPRDAAPRPAGLEDLVTETEEKTVVLTTNVARVTFSNRGGDITGFELLEHRDGDHGIQMADNVTPENRAFALSFGGAENAVIDGLFSVDRPDKNVVRFSKPFAIKNAAGGEVAFNLVKQYTFLPDEYLFRLDVIIEGAGGMNGLAFGDYAYTLRTSPQIGPPFNLKVDRYERRIFMSYNGQKKKRATVAAGKSSEYKDEYVWTGVSGKYFTILAIPGQAGAMKTVKYSSAVEVANYANSQVFLQRSPLTSAYVDDYYYLYVGPLNEKILKKYDSASENGWGLSGLHLDESLNSTGVLSWLEAILKWCLDQIYRVAPNWGIAIIILTIILKLVTFPLTRKSSLSSLKMQELQPRMQELQTKYKENPQKLQQEMAKLYKEVGYSPMSGCLPLLIQFPLLLAMFNLFNNYFEFRGSMFIPGWIPDLSVGDSVYTLAKPLPFLGDHIRILPVVYVISQLLSGRLMTAGSAGGASGTQTKIMMYGMPIFFFFLLYNAPSGLVIYWTVSNALQLVQQLVINRLMKQKRAEITAANSNSKVFVPKKRKK